MSEEYESMQVEKWVNLEDVAVHLSVSQDTVRTWIKEARDINLRFQKSMNGSVMEK